ncbi:MAG: efflux RND transporter periplasmic adaptor subunit [Caulobacterales bacterium]
MTRQFPARALSLALLLAACQGKPEDEGVKPTALVTTTPAVVGQVADTVTAYGAAEFAPQGEHTLVAPLDAQLGAVLAPAGSAVRAGQPVVVLRASPNAQIDLTKAGQDAATAEAAYARAQRLRATGLDSDADVETARAAAVTATKTRQSLGARMAGLVLRAPIAGVVESISQFPGDMAAAGATVAKIGDVSQVRMRLGLEPSTAARVRVGAVVHLSALSADASVDARVTAVDPRADAQTRLAAIYVSAPAGRGFAPGVPLRGVVVLGQRGGAVVLPRAAILYEAEQPYVFVAAGGAAHRRDVKLGAADGDRVEIADGVKPGERVVVDGASALDDGMAVREGKPAAPAGEDE